MIPCCALRSLTSQLTENHLVEKKEYLVLPIDSAQVLILIHVFNAEWWKKRYGSNVKAVELGVIMRKSICLVTYLCRSCVLRGGDSKAELLVIELRWFLFQFLNAVAFDSPSSPICWNYCSSASITELKKSMQGTMSMKGQKWKRVQPNNILKSYEKDNS